MAETVEKDVKESVARNKRARHDYHILDTWEAGVVLTGSEVKSLRNGKANIADSYAIVKDGEVFLLNLHISPYEQASYFNHEPTRTRKLLLHRKEIRKMIGAVERQGLTLIPLEIYFKRGKAKVALALGKGKNASITYSPKGPYIAWSEGPRLMLRTPSDREPKVLAEGAYIQLSGAGPVYATWEDKGSIVVEQLP